MKWTKKVMQCKLGGFWVRIWGYGLTAGNSQNRTSRIKGVHMTARRILRGHPALKDNTAKNDGE